MLDVVPTPLALGIGEHTKSGTPELTLEPRTDLVDPLPVALGETPREPGQRVTGGSDGVCVGLGDPLGTERLGEVTAHPPRVQREQLAVLVEREPHLLQPIEHLPERVPTLHPVRVGPEHLDEVGPGDMLARAHAEMEREGEEELRRRQDRPRRRHDLTPSETPSFDHVGHPPGHKLPDGSTGPSIARQITCAEGLTSVTGARGSPRSRPPRLPPGSSGPPGAGGR